MTLRTISYLEVICGHPRLIYAKLYHPRSMVPELHDMRIVCLLKAVTPAWVINTASFTFKIDFTHYSGPFEILQAKVECLLSVGPARLVPRALNKHYFAHGDRLMYLSCFSVRVTR